VGNPHFWQHILAKTCFKALPITLKKWQLITATLEFNAGKAQSIRQARSSLIDPLTKERQIAIEGAIITGT